MLANLPLGIVALVENLRVLITHFGQLSARTLQFALGGGVRFATGIQLDLMLGELLLGLFVLIGKVRVTVAHTAEPLLEALNFALSGAVGIPQRSDFSFVIQNLSQRL